jgi:hypothetical protein
MKYIITETQLKSIILSEQKTTEKDIMNKIIDNTVKVKLDKKIEGLKFSDRETTKSVLDRLQTSNLQFNAFYISSEGYKFPIFPASIRKNFDWGSVKMSYEPTGPMKTAMIHITAPVGK